MSAPTPKTIAEKINAEILELIDSGIGYLQTDSFLYRRLLRDTENLIRADPVRGLIAKAVVLHFTGNYTESISLVRTAERLESSNSDLGSVYTQISADLGYFSDAYKFYQDKSLWDQGNHPSFVYLAGIHIGALRLVQQRIEEAKFMNIELPSKHYVDAVQLAVESLNATQTTEVQITGMMDCAGEILRKNRIFRTGTNTPVRTYNDDDESFVHMELVVPLPLRQVSEMNFELAELISEKIPDIPSGFHVSFKWSGK